MTWAINVVGALCLTTLTGSVLFLFWYGIGSMLDRMGYVNILYDILRVNSLFFFLPVIYFLFCYLDDRDGMFYGILFFHTQVLTDICWGIFRVWLLGFLWTAVRYGMRDIFVHRKLRTGNEGTSEEQIHFQEICRRLRIPEGRVGLYHSDYVSVPCLAGILKPRVLLPEKTYTRKEREIIFLHELTHYRQKDLWLKRAALTMVCVYWFNPLAYRYRRSVEVWSEYMCDYRAYPKAKSVGEYMEVLGESALKGCRGWRDAGAMLFENENEVVRRLKRLKAYPEMKKKPAAQAAIVCLVLCLFSSATVFAASGSAAEQYVKWYRGTVVEIEEVLQEPEELQEYMETEPTPGVTEEIGEVSGDARMSTKSFAWTVGSYVLKKTEAFYAEEARSIEIAFTITPSNKQVRAGIIEPDGTKRYILVTGSGVHTFLVKHTGDYRVFVENTNEVSVEAGGSYTIR